MVSARLTVEVATPARRATSATEGGLPAVRVRLLVMLSPGARWRDPEHIPASNLAICPKPSLCQIHTRCEAAAILSSKGYCHSFHYL
jgi:hypothetical protein